MVWFTGYGTIHRASLTYALSVIYYKSRRIHRFSKAYCSPPVIRADGIFYATLAIAPSPTFASRPLPLASRPFALIVFFVFPTCILRRSYICSFESTRDPVAPLYVYFALFGFVLGFSLLELLNPLRIDSRTQMR